MLRCRRTYKVPWLGLKCCFIDYVFAISHPFGNLGSKRHHIKYFHQEQYTKDFKRIQYFFYHVYTRNFFQLCSSSPHITSVFHLLLQEGYTNSYNSGAPFARLSNRPISLASSYQKDFHLLCPHGLTQKMSRGSLAVLSAKNGFQLQQNP